MFFNQTFLILFRRNVANEKKWKTEDLTKALQSVREGTSIRRAGSQYDIPRSTLSDYTLGKLEIGKKTGPPTILTAEEEKRIAEWALQMCRIGYGRTKEQILLAVQRFIEKDGRPNPFSDNKPGRKWFAALLKRHPQLSLRMPEQLESYRAIACTKEKLDHWYSDFIQFLELTEIPDDPRHFWNADESGFCFCPRSGRVLAEKNMKDVYSVHGSNKEQITTLCAISAAGETIPPMHIFPGQCFGYNPLRDSVPGAYFGKSPSGWIDLELFYGWMANHFARHVKIRPAILLVDGHKSHINIETSKFCYENDIHLYCLPAHSSYITQPLDVGFFKPLKDSWKKSCERYRFSNPGSFPTKQVFSQLFKEAWYETISPLTIIHAFKGWGIYPVNCDAI